MQRLTLFTSLSFGLGASLWASAAFAQDDCSTDADCEAGFVCGVIGSSGCAGGACPDNDPDCKVEPVDCAPEEFYGCVPAPCESDADCGADMVCEVTAAWESCSGAAPACDEDGNCEPTPVPECESGTTSQCVYKWETTCEADADCGEGFTCERREAGCDCASGGGSEPGVPEEGGDDGGDADFAAPPAEDPPQGELPPLPEEEPTDCGCGEPEVYTYCAAEEISCESNADCPSSWTCETIYERDCGDVAVDSDDSTDSAAERPAAPIPPADDDGEPPPDESEPPPAMDGGVDEDPAPQPCEPVVVAQMCVPPGRVGVDEGGVSTGADGGGEGVPLGGDPDVEDDEAEEPPTDDEADDDVGSADDDATDDEDETDDDEADDDEADDDAPGGESDDDDEADDDDGSEKSGVKDDGGDDSSCSVAQTGSSGGNGAWAALLLGLPLILRRRRNK